MDRVRKLELIQRSLGLRHKLKVHESMEQPETHEDLATSLLSKWELEDELRAVEEILAEARSENVGEKKGLIEQGVLKPSKRQAQKRDQSRAKKKKKKT